MKNFWNISLFKVSILLIVSLYTNSIYVYILCLIYLLISRRLKDIIFYIFILTISLTLSSIKLSPINIGIVDNITSDTSCIVDSILYRTKCSKCENLEVGDVVLLNDESSYKSSNEDYLKKNIIYTNKDDLYKIYELKTRKLIESRIESFNDNTKAYLNNILLNEYNSIDSTISFGFCFYYLFMFIYRKNKFISYISLGLYILLFGFEIKLILIFITLFTNLFSIDKRNKLGLKIILIMLINKYLLLNYSILVTLIISSIYMLEKDQRLYISIMQSMLFNYINPLFSFLYKYVIISKIISFILALLTLLFNPIEYLFMFYINILSFLMNLISIEVRGRLNIIILILILVLYRLFKIKNEYIKIGIIVLALITPINNPFAKVTFIDVGQGDSILIRDKLCSGNLLIDTGSEYNYYKLKRYLYSQGIYKINKLIITHNDSDHNGNIENLKKDFKIDNIIDSKSNVEFNDSLLINLDLGTYDNDNDNSLVYYLNYYGLNYLFTGDISKTAEKKLISQYPISVDILKVGHHGSKNSSSSFFISKLLPKLAVISTNGMYSHPHKEVIEILNKYEIPTLITKNEGDIEIIYTSIATFLKTANNHFVIIKT